MTPLRAEIRKMLALGLPVAGVQLSTMLLGFVDTVMVGRVSIDAMAAATLGNVWVFGTLMFASGVLFGLDPIVAQAHGARDGERAGRALQTGLVMALLLALGASLLWLQTERFLLWTGQQPELAGPAAAYTRAQIPGAPFFLVYMALRQYLQARELVRPALWVILAANLANAFFNWVLIFGHLGAPALGLVGAGFATALTRAFTCLGLVALVLGLRLHRGAWRPWDRGALDAGRLWALARLGVPIAFQMGLEMWAFGAASLLAGRIGGVEVAAHSVSINLAAMAFMLPLGLSQGAATRVGNQIGAGDHAGAQRAAWVSLAMGSGIMGISALAFVALREILPRIYTPELPVIEAAAAVLPIAAAFQIFDGTQVVACGILRGMGRVRPALLANAIGYWCLGLPLGAYLGLFGGWGLAGIWWGLCLGLGVVASLLVGFVYYRGPASVGADWPAHRTA